MSAVFPDKDFLSGNWQLLSATASPYPDALPDVGVLDFDTVKDDVCRYRGYRLCSVDAVLADRDGHFYFIEFKNAEADPIAQLRKKAFDSLLLFWIAVGQSLSMEDIRGRSSFWYVIPDASQRSAADQLGVLFEMDAGEDAQDPLPHQLDSVRQSGLYAEVRAFRTARFMSALQSINMAGSLPEFIACARRPSGNMRRVGLTCVASMDFKTCVQSFVSLRMDLPFVELMNKRDRLLLYDGYDGATETVTLRHSWNETHPRMVLATKTFDTSVIWAAAFHADRALSASGGVLNGAVTLEGIPPPICRPQGTSSYVLEFYDTCSPYFNKKDGLQLYIDNNLYQKIDVSAGWGEVEVGSRSRTVEDLL